MNATVTIISNNGAIGGGEVMMLALAEVLRDAGTGVRIVTPARPGEAAGEATARGFEVLEIPCDDRPGYLEGLVRHRPSLGGDLWWCNGLVPALATAASTHRRVVQLHQPPTGLQRVAWRIARPGAARVFVPSHTMRALVPGSTALVNWTHDPGWSPMPAPAADGRIRIGFIGRFSPIKGLHVLARAVQRLDRSLEIPVELVLAGDGRFVPTRERSLVGMELARVRSVQRLGWVDRAAFFDAVDLVVAPSVWSEPFGLVAAEAMAYGRPIVVSDAGALSEIVGPHHPWVARADDPVDTARVIERFLATDRSERESRRLAARRRWESEFSPAAGAARVSAALAELGLAGRPSVDVEPVRDRAV